MKGFLAFLPPHFFSVVASPVGCMKRLFFPTWRDEQLRPHASQKITQGSAACHQTFCPFLLKGKSAIDNQQQDSTCAEFRHSPSSYSSSDKCCIAHKRVITDYTLSPYSIITNVFFSNVLPLLLIWMSRCITHHVFYADIWKMCPCF